MGGSSAKEARAGDRLPYLRMLDESTLLLRDGSVMTAIQVPGLLFETEDSEALNAHAATREIVLRSTLDARFVLYHHVIRRRVSVDLEAEFPDPISRHIDDRTFYPPVVVETNAILEQKVVALTGGDHVVVPAQAQLHWLAAAVRQQGGYGRNNRGLTFFPTEAATHASDFDCYVVLRDAQYIADAMLNLGRVLGR